MKNGCWTLERIENKHTKIDSLPQGFTLYEHNIHGEDQVICLNHNNNTYCYTMETLIYTVSNQDEFEWYKLQ